MKLPACILKLAAADVLDQNDFDTVLSAATAGGITGVLLTDTSGSDGAALYEAACKVKEQLRARAVLLIADRTDIADAAEADGVILSSKGGCRHKPGHSRHASSVQGCCILLFLVTSGHQSIPPTAKDTFCHVAVC